MITSGSEYVGWAKSGNKSFSGYGEDNMGVVNYSRTLPTSQTITITNPTMGGKIGGAFVYDIVQKQPNGSMLVKSTGVNILGAVFALATFLALSIDWGTREPIIWAIDFRSDDYTAPFTLPVFLDPLSYSYVPPLSSLSSTLKSF